jgi:hypothetical protein
MAPVGQAVKESTVRVGGSYLQDPNASVFSGHMCRYRIFTPCDGRVHEDSVQSSSQSETSLSNVGPSRSVCDTSPDSSKVIYVYVRCLQSITNVFNTVCCTEKPEIAMIYCHDEKIL